MSRQRKNAGKGYGMIFHGNFKTKAEAVAKERKVKGGFIQPKNIEGQGRRYMVMSERKNPIRRKKKNPSLGEHVQHFFSKRKIAKMTPEERVAYAARWGATPEALAGGYDRYGHKRNPSELVVMGANPNPHGRTITARPGDVLRIEIV